MSEDFKLPVIELIEYNFFMSLMDYLIKNFKDITINGKKIEVSQSYSDQLLGYNTTSLAVEILYRKNRSVGFGNYLGDMENVNDIVEIDGVTFEYRIQLNVYSNTRGESYKWGSTLDEILRKGEVGIPLNTYLDNGSIKQDNIGVIKYDYAQDVKSNPMNPNIKTYDFHTIYEVKMNLLQQYTISYNYMEIGDIIGQLKSL